MAKEVYIDGDVLPYQIGFATQRIIYRLDVEGQHSCSPFLYTRAKRLVTKYVSKNPDMVVTEYFYAETPIQVLNTVALHLSNIVRGSKCHTFKVVLSGKDNFRDRIATIQPYKGNRVGTPKPIHYDLIRNWLLEKQYTIVAVDEEADDVISKAMIAGHVGASPDKDLNNTPGSHYNFRTNERYEVSEAEAMRNFYTQMLVGDTADHIPGIRGVGPKTAAKLFQLCSLKKDYEAVIRREYSKVYPSAMAAMIEVGQLLWMRRKDGEMWEPSIDGH